MKNKIFVLFTILFISSQSYVYSLEKITHKEINKYIAQNTINNFSLDSYLKENLGFADGAIKKINGKEVFKWLGDGGRQEDIPVWRAFRHFHNPLEPWDSAGLKDSTLGRSSIIWAQSLDQSYGNYAWQDARNYALTGRNT